MGAFWECAVPKALPPVLSRLSAILACLLALLVASPLCCCAAKPVAVVESSKCCCGGGEGPEDQKPEHRCPCASDDPREIPDPALIPPQGSGLSLEGLTPTRVLPFPGSAATAPERPRWMPALPWHAPPAERRARLMSRLI